MKLRKDLNLIVPAQAVTRCGPFPNTVYGQKSRFLKRRREKSGGSVGLVVFRKKNHTLIMDLVLDQLLHPQFLLDPQRNRHHERADAGWCISKISFKNSFEFNKRLIIKTDIIQLIALDSALLEAIMDSMTWKGKVMLFAGKALFLRGRNNGPILHQTGCAVVIKC